MMADLWTIGALLIEAFIVLFICVVGAAWILWLAGVFKDWICGFFDC